MTSKLIAVIDNGRGKRGGTCDDCGAALRYEYHTEDGGRYGSCCVHAHIHRPDWLTLKAAKDAETFARRAKALENLLPIAERWFRIPYNEYGDDSISIPGLRNFWESGHQLLIETLKEQGWKSGLWRDERGFPLIAHFTRRVLYNPKAYAPDQLESLIKTGRY